VFATRPELRGSFGMVSSTHWLASATGMAVLERGGDAFDAAVAAGFVLQVVEPHLNGPGGEVPILAAPAGQGRVLVVNGQGPVPAAATIERFAGLGLGLIPGTGLLAACVPGAFGAWLLLLRDHGALRVGEVLEPAIGHAEAGFPAVPRIGGAIAAVERTFREEWTSSAEVWLAGGIPPPGRRVRHPGPGPGAACGPGPRRPPGTATGRSRPPWPPSTRASWPRRSPASWPRPRSWTGAAGATRGCWRGKTWPAGGARGG